MFRQLQLFVADATATATATVAAASAAAAAAASNFVKVQKKCVRNYKMHFIAMTLILCRQIAKISAARKEEVH